MEIEFYKHNIGDEEKKKVLECLDGIFLTTGAYVVEFENKFAQYLGAQYAVGLTSGTAALHLSLLALGVGQGDEVITTPMTFVATANAILYTGATPVFVDVNKDTGLMDPVLIEKAINNKTKAILPVHLYGQMCDMRKIREIADRHNLSIVEDSAHCIEGERDGVRPGQLSDVACFSFYATKSITSGEGGAIVSNNEELAAKIRLLRCHGLSKEAAGRHSEGFKHWDTSILGWKYNMSNIQAALLLHQLENIEKYWQKRDQICCTYEEAFKNNHNITCLKILPNSKSARHMMTILVPPKKRDDIMRRLQKRGIGASVNYRVIHLLSHLRETYSFKRGMFPVAEKMGDGTITLPMYPKISEEEIHSVIRIVNQECCR